MSIKLTLGTLIKSKPSLDALVNVDDIPSNVGLRLKPLYRHIDERIKDYFEVSRDIKKKYGYIDENGDAAKPTDENKKAATDELKKVLDEEIELPFMPIHVMELEEPKMKPAIYIDLDWLLVE